MFLPGLTADHRLLDRQVAYFREHYNVLGKVPRYCAAWCNLKSVRNALKCGFRPAWVALTARDTAFVDEMNDYSR